MYNKEAIYSTIDIIYDPAIILDTKTQMILHANEKCKEVFGILENHSVKNLRAFTKYEMPWEQTRDEVVKNLRNQKNYVLHNVNILTCSVGIQNYDLRIGYIDEKKELMCIVFAYSSDEMESMVKKNYYIDMIYSLSSSYPFFLDIEKREIRFIGPILEHFKLEPIVDDYHNSVIERGVLHESDIGVFNTLVEKMYRGEPPTDVFRAYDSSGKILWYKAEYIVHRDSNGQPIEVVGEFVNIQHAVELETKLRTDGLTGCYTKTAFEETVNCDINIDDVGSHALLIIDVDNFKTVNDNLGHQFGDIVLQEIGENLRKIFRSSDRVGRIGGDEFMVFMRDIKDVSIAQRAINRVLKSTNKTYNGKNKYFQISASIGVALFPQDGLDFETLYKNADIALYDTKNKGKNGFTFYQNDMKNETERGTTPFDVVNRATYHHFDTELVTGILDIMLEETNLDLAMNMALQRLGSRFGNDRSYVFEIGKNGLFSNTHEWCNDGISSHQPYLQNLDKKYIESLSKLANEHGIVYCNDMSYFEEHTLSNFHSKDIKSCLCSFVKDNDEVKMMIGFDDCATAKAWSPVEVSTLMYVSKILAHFTRNSLK